MGLVFHLDSAKKFWIGREGVGKDFTDDETRTNKHWRNPAVGMPCLRFEVCEFRYFTGLLVLTYRNFPSFLRTLYLWLTWRGCKKIISTKRKLVNLWKKVKKLECVTTLVRTHTHIHTMLWQESSEETESGGKGSFGSSKAGSEATF